MHVRGRKKVCRHYICIYDIAWFPYIYVKKFTKVSYKIINHNIKNCLNFWLLSIIWRLKNKNNDKIEKNCFYEIRLVHLCLNDPLVLVIYICGYYKSSLLVYYITFSVKTMFVLQGYIWLHSGYCDYSKGYKKSEATHISRYFFHHVWQRVLSWM